MNFSLPIALNLIKEGRANEAVDQLNKFIEYLQPQSPQTQLIAHQLGIDCDFFRQVKYSDFQDADQQIQVLRFKYYAYKIAKWGYQIIQQRRKVKRRPDLIDKMEQLPMQNEIGRTFGGNNDPQLLAESRLRQIEEKIAKKKQIYQKQLETQIEIEKKRTEYQQKSEKKLETIRKCIKTDYEKKLCNIKEHLNKVQDKQKQNKKLKKKIEDELINKRSELLKNSHLIDEKIHKLETMRKEQIEHLKQSRSLKKQRQHSFQEHQNQEYEKYLEEQMKKLEQKRIVQFHSESHKDFGRKIIADNFDVQLQQIIKKYESSLPLINKILVNRTEEIKKKKDEEKEKEKQQTARKKFNEQNTPRSQSKNVDIVLAKKEKRIKEETILRKEIYQQRVQNFVQNRQQLQRLQSQQVERYNEIYTRQTNRLKNMRITNEQMKSTINFALMQANRMEEDALTKVSRTLQQIHDPDQQNDLKPNEKQTDQQKAS